MSRPLIGPDGEEYEREPADEDEPRPRRPRRCPACGWTGCHSSGCPEQED
jgi:hypothetical protein